MRSAIFFLAAAAAVSADKTLSASVNVQIKIVETCAKPEYGQAPQCKPHQSETYKKEVPAYRKYNCDATETTCHAPDGYGAAYKSDGYHYQHQFAYPGPKARFCLKVKKIKAGLKKAWHAFTGAIKKVIGAIALSIKWSWKHFKAYFLECFAVMKSDWERFEAWKKCKEDKWAAYWAYYHDLCRTRKALWDDAMREFHRHWHHYKKERKSEYEEQKKKCHSAKIELPANDYDESPEYKAPETANYLGATPYEATNYGIKYDKKAYNDHCQKANEEDTKVYGPEVYKPYTE